MNKHLRKILSSYCTCFALALVFGTSIDALGQTFPTKSISLAIPLPPSSSYYIALRQMADQIQAKTGRVIVFDPVVGADGTLAPVRVKRAEADGYTIGVTWSTPITLNPLLARNPPYDPMKDFYYLTMLTRHGILFASGSHFPPGNLQELIAFAKANPKAVKVGHSGTASRVGLLQLAETTGVTFLDVPYKSAVQAETAALSGEIDLFATTAGTALGQVKAGRVRPIFIGSRNRSPIMPDVQSASEIYPNAEIISWYALYAPTGVAADRMEWHRREWTTALKDPKVIDLMQNTFGYEIVGSTPQALLEQIKGELSINARTVKQYDLSE